jgi:HAD superfamily hydrolase (TIGR01509 family)
VLQLPVFLLSANISLMRDTLLFDFHNTLATCDGWLRLEIRDLPGRVLGWLSWRGLVAGVSPHTLEQAEALFAAVREGARSSGVEVSAVEGARLVLVQLGIQVSAAEVERAVADLQTEHLEEVEPVEGAFEAIWELRDHGFKLGVVSSAGWPPFVETALERIGLRDAFDVVVTSAGEGIYKSNPAIYGRALARLGSVPSLAIHVGDHPRFDVETARAAGLATVWFNAQSERTLRLHRADWEHEQQLGARADAIVSHMADLPATVLRLARETTRQSHT